MIIGEDIFTCQYESENIFMFNERLREQRELLKLYQQDVADIVGVSKRTVIDWEKGISSPTGVQLTSLFYRGFDITYIVTGLESSQVFYDKYEPNPPLVAKQDNSTNEEKLLLKNYQSASEEGKKAIETVAAALAKQSVKQKIGM